MTDPLLRASDTDRQRVVADLERHTAAGRLSLDEFASRVDAALAARTHGDLGDVVADLPAGTRGAENGNEGRHLVIAFVVAAVVVSLLAVIISIYR